MGLTQIFPWLTYGNWDCEAPALAYAPPPCWSLRIIMAQILLWWTGWRRCHQPAHLSSPMSWGFSWEDKEWKRTSDQIFNIKMKSEDRGVPFSSGPLKYPHEVLWRPSLRQEAAFPLPFMVRPLTERTNSWGELPGLVVSGARIQHLHSIDSLQRGEAVTDVIFQGKYESSQTHVLTKRYTW